tara:strand:- start:7913 stop:8701 length:789 start_codon:yes stop_codon:yes gene_type:complete
MCLIVFNWQPNSHRPLTLAANRDEFHQRASLDAHFWDDHPSIFAGRDLEKQGTWLGLSKNDKANSFKMAALTNFRRIDPQKYLHSRGEITRNFLASEQTALEYAQEILFSQYAGFNGLFFDGEALVYCHYGMNADPVIHTLDEGIYGLSNAKLDSPWPKSEKTKVALQTLDKNGDHDMVANQLFNILRDDTQADDSLLPDTGIGIEFERLLSPAFIISPSYGTRTSSVVIINQESNKQTAYFKERQFSNKGESIRELSKELS